MINAMPSGQEIVNMIMETREIIDACVKDLAKKGHKKSAAEQNYRIALAKEIMIQREKGTPVTIISDICRGKTEIAKLKYDRDLSDILFDIVKTKIYTSRTDIEVLKIFYKSEYQKGD